MADFKEIGILLHRQGPERLDHVVIIGTVTMDHGFAKPSAWHHEWVQRTSPTRVETPQQEDAIPLHDFASTLLAAAKASEPEPSPFDQWS